MLVHIYGLPVDADPVLEMQENEESKLSRMQQKSLVLTTRIELRKPWRRS